MSPLKQCASILLVSLLFAGVARGAESDVILGTWLVKDKTGKIKIFKCGDHYCGKTIWIKPSADRPEPEKTLDIHNPDPKKRGRKAMGKTMLWGLSYDSKDKRWEDGSVYDSRSGKVYSCRVTIQEGGKLLLRGFLGISLIGKTTTWTRVR